MTVTHQKNILFLVPRACFGGAEKMLDTLIRQLGTERVSLFFLNPGPWLNRIPSSWSTNVIEEGFSYFRPWNFFSVLRRLNQIIQMRRIDVIVANSSYLQPFAWLAAKLSGVRWILWQHGPMDGKYETLFSPFAPDLLLANSEFTLSRHRRLSGARGPGRVLYNGTSIPKEQKAVEKKSRFRMGIFARLEWGKGIHFAIEALAPWLRSHKEVELWIMGETFLGDEDSYSRDLKGLPKQLRVDSQVSFIGFQSDVAAIYDQLDLVLSPSLNPEGFGLVVIEAMARGKVIVASALGATPEIVVHGVNGLLFEPGDPKALVSLVSQVYLEPELRSRLGSHGRRTVVERFSETRLGEEFEDILEAVATGQPMPDGNPSFRVQKKSA